MRLRPYMPLKASASLVAALKSGSILLLFVLSILIVACSDGTGGDTGTANAGGPTVTVTIHLGTSSSPTPPLPPYWCGAWVTQTSPYYGMSNVGVYAKFTKNVDGNPEGVDGATATATVLWPDTSTQTESTLTTSDGLAVFSVSLANKKDDVNAVTLITVTFTKPGVPDCKIGVDRAAFFTLVAPSPTATKVPSPTGTPGTPTVTPGPSPTP